MTIDRFFGTFAGDAFARERATSPTLARSARRGAAFCEGCQLHQPIAGKSKKGWRCGECRNREKAGKKSAESVKITLTSTHGYPKMSACARTVPSAPSATPAS